MGIQTATTGNIENIQNIIIAAMRYTAEAEAPCWNLCTSFTLGQGEKTITSPKVGKASMSSLTDGVDMTASQDFSITSVELTTAEVGAKFILTDRMVRQITENGWKMAGTLLGDGMARKRDTDVIALFSGLDSAFGADGQPLNLTQAMGCVANMRKLLAPRPIAFVHGPTALAQLAKNAAGIGTATLLPNTMSGYSEERLRNFWRMTLDGVPFLEAGNIAVIGATTSGYGAIFSKAALAVVESKAPYTERERDASLRGEELIIVADYGCFELDGSYGASCRYEIGNLATTT
ncbi:MAG: hypothetical protein V1850_05510 [Candidatus Bathyarchaeota archaeon]